MSEIQWQMKSKVGPLYLVASDQGLHGLFWKKQEIPMAKSLAEKEVRTEILMIASLQLEEYFAGKRKKFDLPLHLRGTQFQNQVWNELKKIPYGETRSYGDIARRLKNEKAVRAVGAANGRNPISIIIPCHRVIGKNGTLTGFAGGLDMKKKLLDLERQNNEFQKL